MLGRWGLAQHQVSGRSADRKRSRRRSSIVQREQAARCSPPGGYPRVPGTRSAKGTLEAIRMRRTVRSIFIFASVLAACAMAKGALADPIPRRAGYGQDHARPARSPTSALPIATCRSKLSQNRTPSPKLFGATGGPTARAQPRYIRYSLRICLIRAIASSTACSGLMPSAATRWTASGQGSRLSDHGSAWRAASRLRQPHSRRSAAGSEAAWPSACGAGRSGPARTAPRAASASAAACARRRSRGSARASPRRPGSARTPSRPRRARRP